MPDLQSLLASVDASRDEVVALLQQLVRIPTVNYGARADTGNESRACDVLRPILEAAGVPVEVHESAPGRGNLLARVGASDGQRLLLMSHTDVVPVEDETLWEHLADVYERLKQPAKALKAWKKALEFSDKAQFPDKKLTDRVKEKIATHEKASSKQKP